MGRLRYASPLACFALIRRWRAKLRAIFLPPTGGGLLGVVRGVMWCLSAMEIPPAGAPLGAGFDCAALFGCRARPYTRCAASLRMTRGGQGRGTKYVRCKI